jgi:outer membrane protein assembly factor BamB
MNFHQAKKIMDFKLDAKKTEQVFFYIFLFWLILWMVALGSLSNGEILAAENQTSTIISGGDRWPMFHNDLRNTGYSSSTAPRTNETAWRFNTGGPVDSPTVSGDLVYFGSYDDNFYALNITDGKVVWRFKTGNNILSPAAINDGLVYFGSEDNNIYALNATSGDLIWKYIIIFMLSTQLLEI